MLLILLFWCCCLFVIKFIVATQNDDALGIRKSLPLSESEAFIFATRLLNGSLQELSQVPRSFIMESILELEKIKLSLDRKLIIWDIIKDNKPAKMLNHAEIQEIRGLLQYVPELDLFHFNVSDLKIVEYLGTFPFFHRRQAGIIGYAMKQEWGYDIMKDLQILQNMKGLICGFSLTDLKSIPFKVFSKLDYKVFKHIWSCTETQLKVMLSKAKHNLVHGPPQSWNAETCRNLSKLMKSLSIKDLETIKPKAMAGIDSGTIEEMSLKQLLTFNDHQVNSMSAKTLSSYRKMTGIIYNNSKNLVCQTLFTLIVYTISLNILK